LRLVSDAIKAVYASVFYKGSKAYMAATSNVIDQEKMAIILQEVVGTQYEERYYPSFSGVARSLNYYPINNEKPEEGIANIAIGLGKYIVDGGVTLRFSPAWPSNVLQTSTLDLALRDTQNKFYALDMKSLAEDISVDDGANLLRLSIRDAEKDDSIRMMVSTYDPYDMMIRDGYYDRGRKVVTFSHILRGSQFPLPAMLKDILRLGAQEMGRPIEIEFAVNLNDKSGEGVLYWLQIRPIVDTKEMQDDDITHVQPEETLIYSSQALGHGLIQEVRHVVYVKTEGFTSSKNPAIAREIEDINDLFIDSKENYVLMGPGRWGSEDQFLGIPVKWPHISQARLIVETALSHYRVEPSQGTHFFQNMTSFGVGYFTMSLKEGYINQEQLDQMPAVFESKNVRVVKFDQPLEIKINGTKSIGIVKVND
ncbi:MAG: PEP/pyruvate-binding domain-containing protein, partial [Bacteroidales bacterium]